MKALRFPLCLRCLLREPGSLRLRLGLFEASLLKSLLGPSLGMSPDDVPDLGVLLIGPMARGAEVSLR